MIFLLNPSALIGNPNFVKTDTVKEELIGRPFFSDSTISPLSVTEKGIVEAKEKVSIYKEFGDWDSKPAKEEIEVLLTCVPTCQYTVMIIFHADSNMVKLKIDTTIQNICNVECELEHLQNTVDRYNVQVRIGRDILKKNEKSIFDKSFTFEKTFNGTNVSSKTKKYDIERLGAIYRDSVHDRCSYVASNGLRDKQLLALLDGLALDNNLLFAVDVYSVADTESDVINGLKSTHIKILNANFDKLSYEWCKLALFRDKSVVGSGIKQVGLYGISGFNLPIKTNIDVDVYTKEETELFEELEIIYVAKRLGTNYFANNYKFVENIELYVKRTINDIIESQRGKHPTLARIEATSKIDTFLNRGEYANFFRFLDKPKIDIIEVSQTSNVFGNSINAIWL